MNHDPACMPLPRCCPCWTMVFHQGTLVLRFPHE